MTEGPSRPALLRENEQLKAEISRLRDAQSGVTERVVYVDNPALIDMIRALQAKVGAAE